MQEKKVTYQELARQAQKKEKHQIVLAIADGKIRELPLANCFWSI